ncbi:hypothetical protein [Aestuariivirga sp.]|uniref:hypothetical protein n=1 Tax=Aestuariivirga sp. TaxID=2650926 RepID=UPI00391D020F
MKTLTTSMILSVLFLSAGAFAGATRHAPHTVVTPLAIENVTVVAKNQVWPPAGQISMEPCNVRRCIDV